MNAISQERNKLKVVQPNVLNMLKFIAFITPYAIISFFVLLSVFNQNMKALPYIVGIMFLYQVVSIMHHSQFYPNTDFDSISTCRIFGYTLLSDIPAYSISVLVFTLTYLALPMINLNIINFPLIVSMMLITSCVGAVQYLSSCITFGGIFTGILIGILLGGLSYYIVLNIDKELLYYNEYVSDKLACSVPDRQHFKCKVYKNGELISTF